MPDKFRADTERNPLVFKVGTISGMSTEGGTEGAQRIIQFIGIKPINPFIYNELRLRINDPIKFRILEKEIYCSVEDKRPGAGLPDPPAGKGRSSWRNWLGLFCCD